MPVCSSVDPEMTALEGNRVVRCHLYDAPGTGAPDTVIP